MTDPIAALDLGTATVWALRSVDGHVTSGDLFIMQGQYGGGGNEVMAPNPDGERS